MTKPKKEFDCVEMKNNIQRLLRERYKGMSAEQIREHVQRELETSQTPIAKWWRSMNRPHREPNGR